MDYSTKTLGTPCHIYPMVGQALGFNGDGKGSWPDYNRYITNRFVALQVPRENWVAIALSLITGAAADYAQANGLTADMPWSDFTAAMAAGPWANKDTYFSLLFRLTRGDLGNNNPVETVNKLDRIRAKLGFVLPDPFWIFALLVNLSNEFRANLLTGPDGKEWPSLEALRTVVLSLAAAQSAAKPQDNKSKGTSWKDKLVNNNGSNGSNGSKSHSKTKGHAGASSSTPTKRKADVPVCYGCGSPHHKISDRDANSKPICPAYDENRFRKGKYPMNGPWKFPGNGKGK